MVYVSTSCLKGKDSVFEKDIKLVLDRYTKLGIENIELGSAHGKFEDWTWLKKKKKDNDLKFIFHANFPSSGFDRMINIASIDNKFRKDCIDHYYKSMEKMRILDTELLSIHSGDANDFLLSERKCINESDAHMAMERSIESLGLITDKARSQGIKIAIENSSGGKIRGIVLSPEDFLRIKKEVRVGLLLDLGHMDTYLHHQHEVKRLDFIRKFEPHILEMHCHKGVIDDEHLLPTKELFNGFSKDTLRKAALTLEVNNATEEEIVKGIKVIEEVLPKD